MEKKFCVQNLSRNNLDRGCPARGFEITYHCQGLEPHPRKARVLDVFGFPSAWGDDGL